MFFNQQILKVYQNWPQPLAAMFLTDQINLSNLRRLSPKEYLLQIIRLCNRKLGGALKEDRPRNNPVKLVKFHHMVKEEMLFKV